MKKAGVTVFILLLISLFSVVASSAKGDDFTFEYKDGGYTLAAYSGNKAEVRIPDTYNNVAVTRISAGAFAGNVSVYKVVIPESITEIEPGAFDGMPSLYEFEASGKYTVDNGALICKADRMIIKYPDAREGSYTVKNGFSIAERAFAGSSVSTLNAYGTINIGDYAFFRSNLKQINLSSFLKSVGKFAFSHSRIVEIVLYGDVDIKEGAFSDCEGLVFANLSSSKLTEKEIFARCSSLLAVSCAETEMIPDMTFAGCAALKTAPVGSSVGYIGKKAFYGCTSLDKATLLPAVTVFDDSFGLCENVVMTNDAPELITADKTVIKLKVGDVYKPVITAKGGYRLFSTSHNVTVNGDGTFSANFEGDARVYAVADNGGSSVRLNVTVYDGDTVVESEHPCEPGKTVYRYTLKGSPERIAVTFSSSDMLGPGDTLVLRDKNGNVYNTFTSGGSAGKTVVMDTDTFELTLDAVSVGCYGFRVVAAVPFDSYKPVLAVDIPSVIKISVGQSASVNAAVSPSDAELNELIYVISDKTKAAVSEDGIITGIGAGAAELTVYSSYYGKSAVCRVEITDSREEFEYSIKHGQAYITGYNGSDLYPVVPQYLGGYPVTAISDRAFAYKDIKGIKLPSSLKTLSTSAFEGCTQLLSIVIPGDAEYFSSVSGVLYNKNKTELVRTPPGLSGSFSVPELVEKLTDGAFYGCMRLTDIALGKAVKSIGTDVFYGCASLASVTSRSDVITSEDGVLYANGTLIYYPAAKKGDAFTVPTGVKSIGAYAFDGAVYLETLNLSGQLTDISDTAFARAYGVKRIEVSGNGKYSSDGETLYENGAIKAVVKTYKGVYTVADGAASILPYAFSSCEYITDVSFNARLEDIGEYAFLSCTSLREIYLPQSTLRIGAHAFYGCRTLSVYVPDNTVVENTDDAVILCGSGSLAFQYCKENGKPYVLTYRAVHGIYTVYSGVNASLSMTAQTDPILLSQLGIISGGEVDVMTANIVSDGALLSAGEHIFIRQPSPSERYLLNKDTLDPIADNAVSKIRHTREYVVSRTENGFEPALSVKTPPSKTEYEVDSVIDSSGLSLYYTADNGKTEVIYDGFTLDQGKLKRGYRDITVYYKGLSVTFTVSVGSAELSGTVTVKGEPRYNSTLLCDISQLLPDTELLRYQWYRDGSTIPGATAQSYIPTAEDIGKGLSVTVFGTEVVSGSVRSDTVTVSKAKASAPPKPAVQSADGNVLTLVPVQGCEYRISDMPSYSNSNVFENMQANKTYIIYQRYKETDTTEASAESSAAYTMPDTLKIMSDKYFCNTADNVVSLVLPDTSVSVLLSDFKNNDKLSVYKNGKRLSGADIVGTGCEIRLYYNNELKQTFTVVITGDVNGDGKITITDYLQIKERILNGTQTTRYKEYASDVNGDGKITITDYLRLKYCILNNVVPEQNEY